MKESVVLYTRTILIAIALIMSWSIVDVALVGARAFADDSPACGISGGSCTISTSGDEIFYSGHGTRLEGTSETTPGSDGRPPSTVYVARWSSACTPFNPTTGGETVDDGCVKAVASCPGGLMMTLWLREVSPILGDWERVRDECVGGSTPPSPGGVTASEIRSVVSEELRTRLPAPVVRVQPGVVVPVNFPVIFSAGDPGPQGFSVSVPLPGQVSATPTYRWSFGDGSFGDGRGTPYDGTLPRVDPWHYVSHLYLAPKPRMTVSLTVTWHATFTVQGLPTFVLDDIVLPAVTHTFAVKEAHATLVSTG